jgi:hypothetical protein
MAAKDSLGLMTPPAVLPAHELSAGAANHSLPGAFSTKRTLIVFDWDDTLCPTSWIKRLLKEHMEDGAEWAFGDKAGDKDWRYQIPAWFGQRLPDLDDVRDSIIKLQRAVIDVITAAQNVGVVCIVTNAVVGWVDQTMNKWLPVLKPYILGHGTIPQIQVIYGQAEYRRPQPGSEAENIDFVDELHELLWWKVEGMSHALTHMDEIYRVVPHSRSSGAAMRSSGSSSAQFSQWPTTNAGLHDGVFPEVPFPANSKDLMNLISIGDSEAEMKAGQLAAYLWKSGARKVQRGPDCGRRAVSAPAASRLPGRPWVKEIKFADGPDVQQIIEQLGDLTQSLRKVVAIRSHLRLESNDLKDLDSAAAAFGQDDPRTQRLLRIQTV